jgi:hypothetical protein
VRIGKVGCGIATEVAPGLFIRGCQNVLRGARATCHVEAAGPTKARQGCDCTRGVWQCNWSSTFPDAHHCNECDQYLFAMSQLQYGYNQVCKDDLHFRFIEDLSYQLALIP